MEDARDLRQRATTLLALAIRAREDGRSELSATLTELAMWALERAEHIERDKPRRVAQQQQQPQPDDSEDAE